ncbi:MAG TPA: ABC transporter permease [Steroidobacteraceae bacterium]|nr:ABC transporter permease [Steroidobacteraceae bacterium]
MFKHYFDTALRHFARHKSTTAINVIGLFLGMVCFLGAHGIADYLSDSDSFFANADRIYALKQKYIPPGSNMSIPTSPLIVFPVGKLLQSDIPELKAVARLTLSSELPVSAGSNKTFGKLSYADESFFDIFSWPFLYGSPSSALRQPASIVLSTSAARRLFGDPAQALGKEVLLYGRTPLTVTGVYDILPGLSHMGESQRVANFDMLASMDVMETSSFGQRALTNWNSPAALTYLLLPADGSLSIEALQRRLQTFDDRHVPKYEWQAEFSAVPLSEVLVASLNAMVGTEKSGVSIIELLYALGVAVLLVSALNYANLSTAQASSRAKEIGLRRVVGAKRGELATQYIGEAVLLTTLAALLAIATTAVITALAQDVASPWSFSLRFIGSQVPLLLATIAIVGLAAGAYPSFILSRISVAEALRSGRVRSGPRFVPSLLVGMQFAATSFLIIAILVMSGHHRNLEREMLNGLGDPLISISNDLRASNVRFEALQSELLRQPHIKGVTAANQQPWTTAGSLMPISMSPESGANLTTTLNNQVHRDYLRTMGIGLIAGRDFDFSHAQDVASLENMSFRDGTSVIVDRALATHYGWSPEEAIGKEIFPWMPGAAYSRAPSLRIVGVAENKPTRILGMGATTSMYMLRPEIASRPIVRVDGAHLKEALAEVDSVWETFAPNIALKRQYADELLASSLAIFSLVTAVFQSVAVLALIIAVLGLVGMSLHVIGRRTHEIGVRKSLGASVRQVLTLLLKDFSKPVLIANVVAWPFAFAAMSIYLSIFVSRSSLTAMPFIGSLLLTSGIACIAVVVQATRAARLNPAAVLRHD